MTPGWDISVSGKGKVTFGSNNHLTEYKKIYNYSNAANGIAAPLERAPTEGYAVKQVGGGSAPPPHVHDARV
jgi:hypothetical protein